MRYRIPDGVLFQTVDNEAVVLHVDSGHYFGLNVVATRSWQLLAEHGTEEAVVAGLVEEFDVDETTAHKDFAQLLQDLLGRGLVVPEADAAA